MQKVYIIEKKAFTDDLMNEFKKKGKILAISDHGDFLGLTIEENKIKINNEQNFSNNEKKNLKNERKSLKNERGD